MSVALRKPMILAEFLAWEERQELRYEFDGFEPVAMTGGTIAHDQITFDLRTALASRLAGKPCRPLGPNVKIIVDGRSSVSQFLPPPRTSRILLSYSRS
jgi:hypothetical protein